MTDRALYDCGECPNQGGCVGRCMRAPKESPTDRDVLERLRERAKEERDFVAHAEANRDDWFSTMPPEISAEAIARAELAEAAADEIERLRRTTAERARVVEEMHKALRKFTIYRHVLVNGTPNGGSCELCNTEWNEGQPEQHKPDCLASLSPPVKSEPTTR